MSRRGVKTLNLPTKQVDRIDQAVAAGYTVSRDEFIRTWAELGLFAIAIQRVASQIEDDTKQGMVGFRLADLTETPTKEILDGSSTEGYNGLPRTTS